MLLIFKLSIKILIYKDIPATKANNAKLPQILESYQTPRENKSLKIKILWKLKTSKFKMSWNTIILPYRIKCPKGFQCF